MRLRKLIMKQAFDFEARFEKGLPFPLPEWNGSPDLVLSEAILILKAFL